MLLKDYYNQQFVERFAQALSEHYPAFNREGFLSYVTKEIEGKEYSQRMNAFSDAFDEFLPDYGDVLEIFSKLFGQELKSFSTMYSDGAKFAPISRYIELHCGNEPEHFQQSVDFIKELTKRYTGEFAMRSLIRAFPQRTMNVLMEWSGSDNAFVRRCASECMRVRLPWAKKLTNAVEQFDLYVKILDNLKNDGDPYVQRSVANNLNDLYKFDPKKAEYIVSRWQKDAPSAATLKIIRHGTRSLRKKKQ